MGSVREELDNTEQQGQAQELRKFVARYPRLFLRALMGALVLVGTLAGFWMHSAYAEFKETTRRVRQLETDAGVDTTARKDLADALAVFEIATDRRYSEIRQDVKEIQQDVKTLLRRR
jgi:hypothetical protein